MPPSVTFSSKLAEPTVVSKLNSISVEAPDQTIFRELGPVTSQAKLPSKALVLRTLAIAMIA